jgi:hypothetical protein
MIAAILAIAAAVRERAFLKNRLHFGEIVPPERSGDQPKR